MQTCEKILQENLIPNLIFKDNISHQFRDIASLPLKMGGLNIKLPSDFENSLELSIKTSSVLDTYDPLTAIPEQEKIYSKIKTLKTERTNQKRTNILNNLSDNEKYALELASEKGASNWLNALPLSRYNFNLNKSEFRDGIYLRYGWEPTNIPLTCACGQSFDLTDAFHCARCGYTHMRNNEIRDTFATFMSEVCFDVEIEPKLQSLQGESFVNNSTTTDEDARIDVKANGLWGLRFSRTFFDVKVFNPHAKTSRRLLKDAYKYHESLKNSKYQQRVLQVEQSSLCPLIFGCTGGAAPAATRTMQRITENLVKNA